MVTPKRYQTKHKNEVGEIVTQLVDGDSWATVVNNLISLQDVAEEVSVRNLRDVPLNEPVQKNPQKNNVGPNGEWWVKSIVGESRQQWPAVARIQPRIDLP